MCVCSGQQPYLDAIIRDLKRQKVGHIEAQKMVENWINLRYLHIRILPGNGRDVLKLIRDKTPEVQSLEAVLLFS